MPDAFTQNKPRFLMGAATALPSEDPAYTYFDLTVKEVTAFELSRDSTILRAQPLREELIRLGGGAGWKKTFGMREAAKEYEAVVLSGNIYWRFPKPVVASTGPGYENPTRDWLFYEAIFNHEKFQKQNQEIEMGSYLIGLDKVKIFVCEGIDAPSLKVLTETFLPDLTPEQVTARASVDCPWKPEPTGSVPLASASPSNLSGARGQVNARTGLQIAMPFNFHDAGGEIADYAIGGTTRSHLGAPLVHLSHTWPMWKSASRSCVCRLGPIKAKGDPWPAPKDPQVWTVHEGETNTRDLKTLAKGDRYFKLADDTEKKCFSVKTGVNFVGKVNQSGDNAGGKNRLETNSIDACLRSDLVTLFDTRAGHTQNADPHLLVLKELLSITEFNPDRPTELGDGMQVRDLSVLDRGKKYLCPISIMYLDRAMKTMTSRYAGLADDNTWLAWADFWQGAYAVPLGRAKALLLLRYAMQMGSPNAQNYLIEFQDGSGGNLDPTGRIVTRDLGDAQLHREILWAIAGPEGEAPPKGGHPSTVDDGAALERLVVEQFYSDKARALEEPITKLCAKLKDHAEYPPPSVATGDRKQQGARLIQYLDTVVTQALQIASNPDLTATFTELQKTLGKHPFPDAIDFDTIRAACVRAIKKPQDKALLNLIDSSVEGKIGEAHAAIAAKVALAPVKYEFGVLRAIKSYVMESGAVDPGRAYGSYSGAQLRWTMFSALTRGSNVSSNTASTDQGIRDQGWQRVLEVNSRWGQAHNKEYVHTLEQCLGVRFNIPWGDAYATDRYAASGPGRYGALANDAYEAAGRYYKEDVVFEYVASSVIQALLESPEGQGAVRAYHARRWTPA